MMLEAEDRSEKTCFLGFANNKDAEQPAHPRSLISAFVIRLLERIVFSTCFKRNFYFPASHCS